MSLKTGTSRSKGYHAAARSQLPPQHKTLSLRFLRFYVSLSW